MKDVLDVPESFFMLFDIIVAFDHFFEVCQGHHLRSDPVIRRRY